jgi:hypothetical protein
MMIVKKKFEFFQLLKKINNFISTKEFKDDKLITFKELLYKRVEEFSEKKDLSDKILMPYIFAVLKKSFFKIKSSNGGNTSSRFGKKNLKRNSTEANYLNMNSKGLSLFSSGANQSNSIENSEGKNLLLLIKFFDISFLFLRVDIQEDISLSALNYIVKNLEDNMQLVIDNKLTTVNII